MADYHHHPGEQWIKFALLLGTIAYTLHTIDRCSPQPENVLVNIMYVIVGVYMVLCMQFDYQPAILSVTLSVCAFRGCLSGYEILANIVLGIFCWVWYILDPLDGVYKLIAATGKHFLGISTISNMLTTSSFQTTGTYLFPSAKLTRRQLAKLEMIKTRLDQDARSSGFQPLTWASDWKSLFTVYPSENDIVRAFWVRIMAREGEKWKELASKLKRQGEMCEFVENRVVVMWAPWEGVLVKGIWVD
ncbi:MAG: hypothetical protein Q9187_004424 [Circinaria calcarea]